MTEKSREARCNCGQLSAICAGPPQRVSVCHCNACNRRAGSAFAWNATWDEAKVTISGNSSSFERTTDTNRTNRYHFCPECGSVAYYFVEMRPGTISIPAGLFADETFPPPTVEVFGERRVKWCTRGDEGT